MTDEFDFVVETQLTPDDWGDYSEAEQIARTFSTTAGTTDSGIRILQIRVTENYQGKLKELAAFRPGGNNNYFRFDNRGVNAEGVVTNFGLIPVTGADQNNDDMISMFVSYMNSRKNTDYLVEVTFDHIPADSYKIFFKTNELFKIIDTNTNISKVFKVLEINYDFGDNWTVRVTGTDNPNQIMDALPQDVVDRYTQEVTGSHGVFSPEQGFKILGGYHTGCITTTEQMRRIPGLTRNVDKLMKSNHWEETEIGDERFITTLFAKDYSYGWANNGDTIYLAVGNSNANPTSVSMQNELARVECTTYAWTDPSGNSSIMCTAEFTNTDFGDNTSFPYLMKEVGLVTTDTAGTPIARKAFWVPTISENLDDDLPSGAQYHPIKAMFKNTSLRVQFNVDDGV